MKVGSLLAPWLLLAPATAFAQGASSGPSAPAPAAQAPAAQAPTFEADAFPSLARVVALARERAPQVAGARAQLGVARAGMVGARLFPVGNPYTEITASKGVSPRNGGSPSLSANFWLPLEVWGQRGRRTAEVEAQTSWYASSLEAQKAAALGEALGAYGSALVEAERVRLLESILANARDEAAVYRARLAAGDATQQDAALAAVEVARNTVALAESRADLIRALAELARATGAEAYEPPDDGSPSQPPPPSGSEEPADRLASRSPHVLTLEGEATFHARSRDRLASEAKMPLSLMVLTGRGELGELSVGAGLALTLPVLRYNQGEQAIASAEQQRAITEAGAQRSATRAALRGLLRERKQVRDALSDMATLVEPAGQASVDAAVAMQKAGKGELLRVLTARRDLATLRARRLELLRREWLLIAQIAALTGEAP